MVAFSTIALSLLAATASANPFAAKSSKNEPKTAFMSKLMNKAQPTKNSQMRRLDGDAQVDLSNYSVRFEKCQFVRAFSDDNAADADSETVLTTQRFVVFRMCPNSSCNSNYGEYILSLDEYLDSTVAYRQEEQEEMCETCEESCQYYDDKANNYYQEEEGGDEDEADEEEDGDERRLMSGRRLDVDCDQCVSDCQKIENMEDNNYMDATNFVGCVGVQDAGDDGSDALYAGPMCASNGSKIKIGVFSDEECMVLEQNLDVEDYLTNGDGYAVKLSHALLKTTYDNEDQITCADIEYYDDDVNTAAGNYKAVGTKEICEEIYQAAAKCEEEHSFTSGINYYQNYYDVQNDNEELVCSFIDSLMAGTYSQEGEIVVGGMASVVSGGSSTTGGQKFALTFFILGTVGLAVYAAMLHSQLTKGGKSSLSSQGGAMA